MRGWLAILISIAVTQHISGEDKPNLAVTEFRQRLELNGAVTFAAWNGKPECFDCATDLAFLRDGSAYMLEWGYALTTYKGTYHISNSGKINTQFRNFRGSWPDMVLVRDQRSLLLKPADPNVGFVMGGRGGATLTGGAARYWPFRMLSGKEERAVLKMIEQRGSRAQ